MATVTSSIGEPSSSSSSISSALVEANRVKDLGNNAYNKKDYQTAYTHYSKAIEIANNAALNNDNSALCQLHVYYSNRAAVHLRQNRFELALSDAQKSIECYWTTSKTVWIKGLYHKGKALSGLKRFREASLALNKCLSLNPEYAQNKQFMQELSEVDREYIASYYAEYTRNLPVKVQYISPDKGKGVFATKSFQYGDTVLVETPLVSHRKLDAEAKIRSCSHCLRTFLSKEDLGIFHPFYSEVYKGQPEQSRVWLQCEHCHDEDEQYCSDDCRQAAWKQYHEVLCVRGKPDKHPFSRFKALARQNGRTNPMIIARMVANAVQRIKGLEKAGLESTDDQIDRAFEPYMNFVSSPEASPGDEEAVALLRQCIPDPRIQAALDIDLFRRLNGALLRNASRIEPVTDFHTWFLESSTLRHKQQVLALYNNKVPNANCTTIGDFLATPFMTQLCGGHSGSGLFRLIDSCNHSCNPNVVVMSCFNSHALRLLAIRPIRPGDEILFSYINEDASYEQRQKELQYKYLFTCACEKCKARK